MASKKTIKSAMESMMFVWGEPLDIKEVAEIFNIDKRKHTYTLRSFRRNMKLTAGV